MGHARLVPPDARVQLAVPERQGGTRRAWAHLFRQFSFPAGSAAMSLPRRPARSRGRRTRYSSRTPTAWCSTTLTCSWRAWSAMAKRRPARWHRLALQQVPQPGQRWRGAADPHLNGYKIANPTMLARIRHEELEALLHGYGYTAVFRRGRRSARDAPADGRDAGRRDRGDPRIQQGAREVRPTAATLADDRAAHPEGMDRPERVDGTPGRGYVPGPPGSDRRRRGETPRT